MTLTTAPAPTERDPLDGVTSPSRDRPHLDGVRSIAVYLVVLFHVGVAQFNRGYIGVDVFFVLSGYLVTQLLLRDLGAGGAVRFGRFYARRFRRLLPAAFVALIGTALIFVVVDPVEALRAAGSFKAAFLYVANWYFIRESTAYFAADVAADPVLQFWSLAVEEQFYLVWPLALGGLVWLARRFARDRALLAVRVVVGLGVAASLAWAFHLRTDDLDRAYFGTDARAYQLLVGASIALIPDLVAGFGRYRRALRFVAPVALAAIVAVGSSLGGGDAIVRGVIATVATAVALVALECEGGGPATRVLAAPPLVYLGKVSYGTYLWHWPVILVLDLTLDLGPRTTALVTALLATGLASLSFQVLEQPVRVSALLDRHRFAVIGTGLTVSLVSALVLVPAIVDPRDAPAALPAPAIEAGTPVPSSFEYGTIYFEGFGRPLDAAGNDLSCQHSAPEECTVVRGSGPHVVLLGDSTAEAISGGFVAAAEKYDFTLSVVALSGCPWQRDLFIMSEQVQRDCRAFKDDAYDRVIPALDPDVIVGVYTGDFRDLGPSDPAARPSDPVIEQATIDATRELSVDGRTVVVLEPLPKPAVDVDPLTCLSTAKVIEECRYVVSTEPAWYELLTRRLDTESDQVLSADFDRVVCPFLPVCDPIVRDTVVRWDGQHLSKRYSVMMGDPIGAYLQSQGLIP